MRALKHFMFSRRLCRLLVTTQAREGIETYDCGSSSACPRQKTSIKEDLDEKEKKWINNELTLGDKSRKAVHHWKEVSRFLPRYLSEDTITKVKELDREADVLISESKIEDVIFYFDKLDNAEKAECIQKLQKRIDGL